MTYSVVFSRRAKKFIDKLEKVERQRIKEGIDELRENPRRIGKPLKGPFKIRNIWSSRVGDFRILYTIFDDKQSVFIVHVGRRKRIYKEL